MYNQSILNKIKSVQSHVVTRAVKVGDSVRDKIQKIINLAIISVNKFTINVGVTIGQMFHLIIQEYTLLSSSAMNLLIL
jgi:hypothetical protein